MRKERLANPVEISYNQIHYSRQDWPVAGRPRSITGGENLLFALILSRRG